MKSRKQLPAYRRLSPVFDPESLSGEYLRLYRLVERTPDLVDYDHSGFFDLTRVNPDLPMDHGRWVGVDRERKNHGQGGEYLANRLEYSRQTDPRKNDRNHNQLKPWAQGSLFVDVGNRLGSFSRVTISYLKPGGWWPAHFDFDSTNAIKIHVPILSGRDSVNSSWDPVEKRFVKVRMAPGEAWFLNPGFKHSANNWSDELRVHLVFTMRDQGALDPWM